MERYTDTQTWYAVFDKCHGRHWWAHLLHKDFQHVHLLKDSRDNCLMINSFAHCMAIKEYPNTLVDIVQQEIAQNCTAILQMTVHYSSHYKHFPLEPLTCVSVAKRILGIRSRLVTPKALYHEMLRAGAIIVKPYCLTQ